MPTKLQWHIEESIIASQNAVSLTPDILKILEETREGALDELNQVGDYSQDTRYLDIQEKTELKKLIALMAMSSEYIELKAIWKSLRDTGNITYQDLNWKSILIYAIEAEYLGLIRELIKFPEIMNLQDENLKTAMMYLIESHIQKSFKEDYIKQMINMWANLEMQDLANDWTVLHYAGEIFSNEIYEILVEAWADETKTDRGWWTAKEILNNYNGKKDHF